mgnify:CR=1 FL=1
MEALKTRHAGILSYHPLLATSVEPCTLTYPVSIIILQNLHAGSEATAKRGRITVCSDHGRHSGWLAVCVCNHNIISPFWWRLRLKSTRLSSLSTVGVTGVPVPANATLGIRKHTFAHELATKTVSKRQGAA